MRRFLSLLIAFVLIMSSMNVVIGQSSDYESNWAKNEIKYMKDKMIISGYPDGTFRPTNNMSKSEFYKIINGVMGFTGEGEVNFNDVSTTDWYYKEVQKGLAANYILPAVSLNAGENITRGEVARIIGVVFDIDEDEAACDYFIDSLTLPEDLKGVIGGLKKAGYINGYSDGTFRADAKITRAEVVKILHSVSGEIVNISDTLSKNINSNLVVNTSGVVLKDMTIEGNLYLTEGIGEGDITLDNVIVKGEVKVNGGGQNSIVIKDSKINKLSVDKYQGLVRVVLENTTVASVHTLKEVKLELTKKTEIKLVELDGKVNLVVEKGASIDKLTEVSKNITIDGKGTIKSIKSTKESMVNGTKIKANVEYKIVDGKLSEVKPTVQAGGYSGVGRTPTPITLSSISIKIPANKLVYTVGDPLDITGLVIEGWYSNGSKKIETITLANVTGFNSTVAVNSQILKVTFGGKTATYAIVIKAAEPQNPIIVNKSALKAKITVAQSVYGADNYTVETWGPFSVALGTAIGVNDNPDATQIEVDTALSALSIAMNNLKLKTTDPEEPKDPDPIEVDKTQLTAAIGTAMAKVQENYTEETWGPFVIALGTAIGVRDNPDATQIEVDGALTALIEAMGNLKEKTTDPEVDKSELSAAIATANEKVEEDYTPESWTSFVIALDEAKVVNNDIDASQVEVNEALLKLTTAMDSLELNPIDPEEPEISNIEPSENKILRAGDTLEVSFNAPTGGRGYFRVFLPYEDSLNTFTVEKVDNNYEMELVEIFTGFYSATWTIPANVLGKELQIEVEFISVDGKVLRETAPGRITITEEPEVDKSELVAAIATANEKVEEDYTTESWAPFLAARTTAIEVNANADVTQEQVDGALSTLINAMAALVEKEDPVDPNPEVDKTALIAAIAMAEILNEETYTPESWAPFSVARTAAIEVNANADATQVDVNNALLVLITAMDGLVERDPLPQPTVTVEVQNSSDFIPALIRLKVNVENIPNSAKFDVVYQLSGGGLSNTNKYDLGTWTTESIFFNPKTITDKITVRIYDATGQNLLHTFTDVVIQNPMLPK